MLNFLSKLGNLIHLYDSKELNAVQAFHQAFKIGCAAQPTVDLPDQIKELRFRLMEEENQEYLEAAKEQRSCRSCGCPWGYALHFVWDNFKSWNAAQNRRSF